MLTGSNAPQCDSFERISASRQGFGYLLRRRIDPVAIPEDVREEVQFADSELPVFGAELLPEMYLGLSLRDDFRRKSFCFSLRRRCCLPDLVFMERLRNFECCQRAHPRYRCPHCAWGTSGAILKMIFAPGTRARDCRRPHRVRWRLSCHI